MPRRLTACTNGDAVGGKNWRPGATDDDMTASVNDKTVLVIGRGSGIARAIAETARTDSAKVIVAGRRPDALADDYEHDRGIRIESIDLNDDDSIAALATRVGDVDHVISTASARARGKIGELERDAVQRSLDTKVIGPLMLARAFRGQIKRADPSFCSPGSPRSRSGPARSRSR
jgi:NAD(P)-dependent dehydrogenase (short-subunit alcohol dehydrogenase family)